MCGEKDRRPPFQAADRQYRDRGRWLPAGAAAQAKRAERNQQARAQHSDSFFYDESTVAADHSFESEDDEYGQVSSEDTRALRGAGKEFRD